MTKREQEQLATEVRRVLREAGETPTRLVAGGYMLRNKPGMRIDGFKVEVAPVKPYRVVLRFLRDTMLPWSLLSAKSQTEYGGIYRRVLTRYAEQLSKAGYAVDIQDQDPTVRPFAWVSRKERSK